MSEGLKLNICTEAQKSKLRLKLTKRAGEEYLKIILEISNYIRNQSYVCNKLYIFQFNHHLKILKCKTNTLKKTFYWEFLSVSFLL